MTTASGAVVHLISRDCCPYLDDYEPDYLNPAAAAVTPAAGNSVRWDPSVPTYDEPKPPVGRVEPKKLHPDFVIQESDSDSDEDCVSWTAASPALTAHGVILPRRGACAQCQR